MKLHQHPIYEDYFYNEYTHEIYCEYLDQVIKPSLHNSGYYVFMVEDFVESTKKSYRLHRFIMECLLGREIKEGYVINHIDGNKANNLPSNLEEVTISRNTKHAKDVEKIFELKRDGEKVYSIASIFNINPKTIYAILGKKRWKHLG